MNICMVAPEHKISLVNTVHVHPMYTVCPYVFSIIGETGVHVAFIESDKSLTFFYLFASDVKSLLSSS
jgi:hypothetical protein